MKEALHLPENEANEGLLVFAIPFPAGTDILLCVGKTDHTAAKP